MDNFDIIKEFFTNMKCSQCHSYFEEESIKILRQENNYTVVRVVCSTCNKNIGLAILGLDKESVKNNSEFSENNGENENLPFESNQDAEPITYDDVIDAHNFFNNLDENWSRFLPNSHGI